MTEKNEEKIQEKGVGGPNPPPEYQWIVTVPQEWFRLVLRGEDLDSIIHGARGYRVNEELEFEKIPPGFEDAYDLSPRHLFRQVTGREFVGIPKLKRTGIYGKKFRWAAFFPRTEGGGENGKPVYTPGWHDQEIVRAFPLVSSYPLTFTNIDVQGREVTTGDPSIVQIAMTVIIRVRMLRPRIALMQNTDWLGNGVSPYLQGRIGDYMRTGGDDTNIMSYDRVIRRDRLNGRGSRFRNTFLGTLINGGKQVERSSLRLSLLAQYGVDLIDVQVVDVQTNEEFEKKLRALADADIDAAIIERQARAEAQKRKLQAEAEGEYIRQTSAAIQDRLRRLMESMGGDAASVRAIEYAYALRDSKLTTLAGAGVSLVVGPDGTIR